MKPNLSRAFGSSHEPMSSMEIALKEGRFSLEVSFADTEEEIAVGYTHSIPDRTEGFRYAITEFSAMELTIEEKTFLAVANTLLSSPGTEVFLDDCGGVSLLNTDGDRPARLTIESNGTVAYHGRQSVPLDAFCNHADSVEAEVLADFWFRPPTENLGRLARYIKSSGEIDPVCIIQDDQMRLLVFAGGTIAEAEIELAKLPLKGRGRRRQREWTFSLPWEFLYLWWELSDSFGLSRLQVSTDADEEQFWLTLRGDSHYVRSGPLFADDLRIMEGVADFDVHANRVERRGTLDVIALENICSEAESGATDFPYVFDPEDEKYGTSNFSCPMVKLRHCGNQITAAPLRLEDFATGYNPDVDGKPVCFLKRRWEYKHTSWWTVLPVYQLQKCLEYCDRHAVFSTYMAQEQLFCIAVDRNLRFYIGDVELRSFGDRSKFPISAYHAPRLAMDTALQDCDYTIQGMFPHPAIIYWADLPEWEIGDDFDGLENGIAASVASQLKIELSDLPGQRVFF